MEIKRVKDKEAPKGGWLGPPPTRGLPPLGVIEWRGKGKKRKAILKPAKLSKKDKKKRKRWQEAMAKADKKKRWRFKWK